MKEKSTGRKSKHPLLKKDRIALVQALIDRNPIGQPFSPEDLTEFNYLAGCSFRNVQHAVNTQHSTDPRHIKVFANGTWTGFSWRKSIATVRDTVRSETLSALRYTIQPDMDNFRDSARGGCERCGVTSNLTTDHTPPLVLLSEDFIMAQGGSIDIDEFHDGEAPQIRSVDVEAAWIAYHAQRVTYALLCLSCNASKGIRV